ncbi:MAG TPA: SurA N-terminal domain-containing protein [Pseudolabrys sp.]|nr:SurA N-terminal domain-containing protein [Pseudolabrys sp.]
MLAPAVARAQVVAVANGSPITELDIQQRTKLMASGSQKAPTRQEVIKELIDDRLKIAKGKIYGLDMGTAEVDTAFANMAARQHITAAQFSQALDRAGISANAVKARIRAEMTWTQLVRGRFGSSLQVADADIASAMRSRNEAENTVGYIYVLYPVIIVIPNGSSNAVMEEKRGEAENLRNRFVSCKSGLAMARAQRDVAVREPITKSSADLPEALRELLAKLEIGRLSTPDVTSQGLQMFALCGKKESAQESPLKHELREKIFSNRFETESKKFLDEIRKSAMIEYK